MERHCADDVDFVTYMKKRPPWVDDNLSLLYWLS